MRKLFIIPAMIGVLAINSCTNKTSTTTNPSGNTTTPVVNNGKWTVSYYYDKDKDETSDYAGYVFEFKTDKTISVARNSQTFSGTWSEGTDDGLAKFNIVFATTDNTLNELSDDWGIESKTDIQLKLKDDNPDRNEQLHFSKQ